MKHKTFNPDRDVVEWDGPSVRYDVFKEVTVCFVVVLILVAALSAIFSSPDEHPVTVKSWSTADPADFLQTAITELAGTSATGSYGPPYTTTPGVSQKLGPISLESLAGTRIPINTAQDFVIGPLLTLPNAPALDAAIATFKAASAKQQASWESAYATIAASPSFTGFNVKPGAYGPVGLMMSQLLSMARSGALDGALLASPQLYDTNYTKPLLFIQDGGYLPNLASAQNLTGNQWGMMNETGSYPGQAWLWLYTLWYQVPPMNTSANGDVEVWAIMMVLTVLLALVPFIPGLRSIPRWTGLYRLVWRRYYRSLR
ncbi:MAG TPA: hypothetical protein VEH29_05155 [Acidimicrobiales bacterium]|nr:hypothetical protein [Acidimicrobiales bacterium]